MEICDNEKRYGKLLMRTGLALILNDVLIRFSYLASSGAYIVFSYFLDSESADVASGLSDSLLYFASFVLPALLLCFPGRKLRIREPRFGIGPNAGFFLMLPAALAVIMIFARINYGIIDFFGLGAVYDNMEFYPPDSAHGIVLQVISTALVPALCEELLFRGVILNNLMPYGATQALVISSVLFGLMHQHPGQIIYTVAAGFVLGYVYMRMKSLWGCVMIHFTNNFLSVIGLIAEEKLPSADAEKLTDAIDVIVLAAGILAAAAFAVLLIVERKRKKSRSEQRGAEISSGPGTEHAEYPISKTAPFLYFLNPPVILYSLFSVGKMAFIIWLAKDVN